MECVRKNLALALGFMLLMLTGFTPAALAQKGNSNSGTVVECKKALSTDGRQVELSVSGQMPAQAKVLATPVQRTAPNGKQVYGAYDITIKNGNAEWQPQAGKPVTVSISDPSFTDGQMMEVYHEGANGNEFVATVKPINHTITFPAKSFSVYIVTEIGEGARLEVVFHQQNGDSTSIFVKAKDALNDETYETVLYDPGVGALVNTIQFRGWYTSETYTVANADDGMSIAEVRDLVEPMLTNVTDGTQYHLYPLLFKIYHVTYYDELGTIISSKEVLYLPNDDNDYHACPINEAYMPTSSEQNFLGWQVYEGGSHIQNHTAGKLYQNGTTININGDVKFKADVPYGHWLVFNENGKGASFTAAQFIENDSLTKEPSEPSRFGYTFGGWYFNAECTGNAFVFGDVLAENTELYAKWTPKTTANYTILIWKQNVHDAKDAADADKNYDFAESISLEGNVNDVITAVTSAGTGDGSYAVVNGTNINGDSYHGFHLNRYDQNVTIVTEGTSVLNVYYDRNLVTLTFYVGGTTNLQEEKTGLYGSSLAENGYTWPTNYWWYENNNANDKGSRTTFLDAFIPSDGSYTSQTFYGFTGSGNKNIRFYKQNDEGGYDLANSVTGSGNFSITDKYNGYKAASYSTNGNSWTLLGNPGNNNIYATVSNNSYSTLHIRFDRRTYNLLYKDGVYVDGNNNPVEGYEGGAELNVANNIPFESSMASYNKGGDNYFEPTMSGFAFEGWYIDDACTQPYTFTAMPEGLTVYAKWRQVQYRVFLHPNAVDPETNELDSTLQVGNQSMCFRVDFGEKVQDVTLTRDDYTLMGWYSDEACTQVFNATMVTLNDGTTGLSNYDKTTDMTDPMNKWGLIVNDSIDPNTGNLITPYNSDITGYNGADRFWINKKLDLYAKWRSKLEGAKGIHIQYVFIDADGTDTIIVQTEEDLFNNEVSTFSIAAPTYFEGMPSSDSVFKHWVLQHWNSDQEVFEDSEVTIYPGSPFTISKNDAQRIDNEDYDPNDPSSDMYIYTIQVRAEYIPVEQATPSHIIWYRNYSATDETIVRQDGTYNGVAGDEPHVVLAINEAVTIPVPEDREGYNFLGWMRYASGDNITPATATAPNFLWYDAETEKFYSNATMTTEATYVAADEEQPYHDLYAIWEAASYTVHFDNNGADGTETMEDQLFDFVNDQDLTDNAFTYTNHCFLGWATTDDATEVAYEDGYTVDHTAPLGEAGETVNLYAVWAEVPTVSVQNVTVCQGAATTMTAVLTNTQLTGVTYQWYTVFGESATAVEGATAATYAPTEAGSYKVVVSNNGCTAEATATLTINPLPTVELTVPTDAQVLCPNKDTYPVSAEATGGTAPYSYAWTGATPTTVNGPAANVLQVENNCTENGYLYTVSVVATDDNGCASAADEDNFMVQMAGSIIINDENTEDNVTVSCVSEADFHPTEYLPYVTDACDNLLEPTLTSVSDFPECGGENATVTYTYTYTDCAGNSAEWLFTYNISAPAAPTLELNAATASPANNPEHPCAYVIPEVTFEATASCDGDITSSTQTPAAGTFVSQTDEEQTVEISVTVVDGCGASATETTTVTIPAKPTVDITASSTTACYGSNVTLEATDGFVSYSWSYNQLTSATITAEVLTETTTFTVTVTDANGCTATASQEVTVGEIGTVEITGDNAVCENGDVTLTAPEGENYTYQWSYNDATTSSIMVSKMTATTTFTVTVTDASGCVSEGEKEVVVNTLPDVTIDEEESVAICDGETVTLTASGASSYVWNDEEETEGANLTVDAEGTYTVTGTDVNGCENTASVTVTVNDLPEVHINTEFAEICSGGTAQLTAIGAESYVWTIPGEDQVVTDDYIEVANLTETTEFTVTGTDEHNCTNTATATVTVNPLPVVELTVPTTEQDLCPNQEFYEVSATVTSGVEPYTFTWSGDATAQEDNLSHADVFPPADGDCTPNGHTYNVSVVVTDDNGCASATAEESFTVLMATGGITMTEVPTQSIVTCAQEIVEPTLPTVTDACGNTLEPIDLDISPEIPSVCDGEQTYTYTYEDCVGNSVEWVYTFIFQAPVLTFDGEITDVEGIDACYSAALADEYLLDDAAVMAMFSSDCELDEITVSHVDATREDNNDCDWEIQRIFTIRNACTTVYKTQVLTGGDQTAPTFTAPAAYTTTFNPDGTYNIDPEDAGEVEDATDNCTTITESNIDYVDETEENEDGSLTITRTWTVTDDCELSTSHDQIITVNLIADPVVVYITGQQVTETYNGTWFVASDYTVDITINGEPTTAYTENDFEFTSNAYASRRDVGTTNMSISSNDFVNRNPYFANVTFVVEDGYVEVTKKAITIYANVSKQYDGTPLQITYEDVTVTPDLADGDELTDGILYTDGYDAGEYRCTANQFEYMMALNAIQEDFTIENSEHQKVNANYSPTFDVTLTITSPDCQGVTYQDHYYPAVQIGTQCWLAENLRNTVYGPEETTDIANYAAFNNDPANMEKFGYLYTWYSTVGVEENNDAELPETLEGTSLVQGICPEGWVVPSQTDFDILYQFTANEERRLRDMNTMYWIPGEQGVEPNYHFNSRAGGFYNSVSGHFERLLLEDYYWTSTSDPNSTEVTSPTNAYYCNSIDFKTSKKADMRSVRCISQQTAYGAPTETEEGEGDEGDGE